MVANMKTLQLSVCYRDTCPYRSQKIKPHPTPRKIIFSAFPQYIDLASQGLNNKLKIKEQEIHISIFHGGLISKT